MELPSPQTYTIPGCPPASYPRRSPRRPDCTRDEAVVTGCRGELCWEGGSTLITSTGPCTFTILIESDRLELDAWGEFRRPVRFSPLEVLAVQLGLQLVLAEAPEGERVALETAVSELRALLRSATAAPEPDAAAASGSGLAYGPPLSGAAAEALATLRRALRERRMVELRYLKPYEPEEPRLRRLTPWALALVRATWYLLARDEGPGEPRVFRLDRILEVRATDDPADIPENVRVEDYIDPEGVYRGDEEDLEVTIHYSPRIARWIRERYGDAAEGLRDGSVVVRHRCKSPWWAVGRVLSYGSEAQLTAPERARALAVETLRRIAGA